MVDNQSKLVYNNIEFGMFWTHNTQTEMSRKANKGNSYDK